MRASACETKPPWTVLSVFQSSPPAKAAAAATSTVVFLSETVIFWLLRVCREGFRQQQIGARHRRAGLRLKRIDDLVDGTGCIGLHVRLGIVAVHRKHLAIINQLDVGIAARAPDPQLVRPTQFELSGTGKLDLL